MDPVALFGEAERGEYQKAYFCKNLTQLVDCLGNPPAESKGLFYATQTLLYQRDLIFFRVREEGFSLQDYFQGLQWLQSQDVIPKLSAICVPGVGNREVIDVVTSVCVFYHSILITTESDFYDYMTAFSHV